MTSLAIYAAERRVQPRHPISALLYPRDCLPTHLARIAFGASLKNDAERTIMY